MIIISFTMSKRKSQKNQKKCDFSRDSAQKWTFPRENHDFPREKHPKNQKIKIFPSGGDGISGTIFREEGPIFWNIPRLKGSSTFAEETVCRVFETCFHKNSSLSLGKCLISQAKTQPHFSRPDCQPFWLENFWPSGSTYLRSRRKSPRRHIYIEERTLKPS